MQYWFDFLMTIEDESYARKCSQLHQYLILMYENVQLNPGWVVILGRSAGEAIAQMYYLMKIGYSPTKKNMSYVDIIISEEFKNALKQDFFEIKQNRHGELYNDYTQAYRIADTFHSLRKNGNDIHPDDILESPDSPLYASIPQGRASNSCYDIYFLTSKIFPTLGFIDAKDFPAYQEPEETDFIDNLCDAIVGRLSAHFEQDVESSETAIVGNMKTQLVRTTEVNEAEAQEQPFTLEKTDENQSCDGQTQTHTLDDIKPNETQALLQNDAPEEQTGSNAVSNNMEESDSSESKLSEKTMNRVMTLISKKNRKFRKMSYREQKAFIRNVLDTTLEVVALIAVLAIILSVYNLGFHNGVKMTRQTTATSSLTTSQHTSELLDEEHSPKNDSPGI